MGQATLDLPDPAQSTPAPLNGADDLLSQLAGQEIDRLLAEADGGAEALEADVAAEAEEPSKEQVEALLDPAKVDAELAAAKAAPKSDTYSEQVDELFKQLKVDTTETATPESSLSEPAPAAPASPAEPPPVASTTVQPTSPASTAAEIPAAPPPITSVHPAQTDAATTAAERAALSAPIEESPAEPEPLEKIIQSVPDNRPSLLVNVLELLNAPFASCPDAIRDLLGKVAILTIMNSAGVLLYVLLFRK